MEGPRSMPELDVGVDIAAVTFTASWLVPEGKPSAPVTLAQEAAGYAAFRQRLQATGVSPDATRVVLEATSTYWIALAVALHEAGYRVYVINPAQAHYFAKHPRAGTRLRRAKTDALDAQDLARLADKLELAAWTPPPVVYHELRQRLLAREALIALRQYARNQRHALVQWPIRPPSASARIGAAPVRRGRRRPGRADCQPGARAGSGRDQRRVGRLGGGADERPRHRRDHRRLVAGGDGQLHARPRTGGAGGVCRAGPDAPPVGNQRPRPTEHRPRRQWTLAPRPVHGDAERRPLGAPWAPVIKPFYDRLRAAGKPVKVARCAAARKLLHLSWALVTKQSMFDPQHRQPQHPETALAS